MNTKRQAPASGFAGARAKTGDLLNALKLLPRISRVNRTDRQRFAEALLGPIRWMDPCYGSCRCPGAHLCPERFREHSAIVRLDGIPKLTCSHAECRSEVELSELWLVTFLGEAEPYEPRPSLWG